MYAQSCTGHRLLTGSHRHSRATRRHCPTAELQLPSAPMGKGWGCEWSQGCRPLVPRSYHHGKEGDPVAPATGFWAGLSHHSSETPGPAMGLPGTPTMPGQRQCDGLPVPPAIAWTWKAPLLCQTWPFTVREGDLVPGGRPLPGTLHPSPSIHGTGAMWSLAWPSPEVGLRVQLAEPEEALQQLKQTVPGLRGLCQVWGGTTSPSHGVHGPRAFLRGGGAAASAWEAAAAILTLLLGALLCGHPSGTSWSYTRHCEGPAATPQTWCCLLQLLWHLLRPSQLSARPHAAPAPRAGEEGCSVPGRSHPTGIKPGSERAQPGSVKEPSRFREEQHKHGRRYREPIPQHPAWAVPLHRGWADAPWGQESLCWVRKYPIWNVTLCGVLAPPLAWQQDPGRREFCSPGSVCSPNPTLYPWGWEEATPPPASGLGPTQYQMHSEGIRDQGQGHSCQRSLNDKQYSYNCYVTIYIPSYDLLYC